MGTKADFYIGEGLNATWIGSISHDAFPEHFPMELLLAESEHEFIQELNKYSLQVKNFKHIKDGWPWHWKDSSLTDFSILFKEKKVYISTFGFNPIDVLTYFKQKQHILSLEEKRDNASDEEFDTISEELNSYMNSFRQGHKIQFPDMKQINQGLKQ